MEVLPQQIMEAIGAIKREGQNSTNGASGFFVLRCVSGPKISLSHKISQMNGSKV
jgi:hypothetical protein